MTKTTNTIEQKLNAIMGLQDGKSIDELQGFEQQLIDKFFVKASNVFNISNIFSYAIISGEKGAVDKILKLKRNETIVLKDKYVKRDAKVLFRQMVTFYGRLIGAKKKRVLSEEQKQKINNYHKKYKKNNYFSVITIIDATTSNWIDRIIEKAEKQENNKQSRGSLLKEYLTVLKADKKLSKNIKPITISSVEQDSDKVKKICYLPIELKEFFQKTREKNNLTNNQLLILATKEKEESLK